MLLPGSVAVMGMLLAAGVLLYWLTFIIPSIRTSERAKAEVIMLYAAHVLEEDLNNEVDPNAGGRAVKRLMLMSDPVTGKRLFLGIKVAMLNGRTFSVEAEGTGSRTFVVSAPIYSSATSDLLGEISIIYNDHLYRQLADEARKNLIYILVTIILGTLFMYWLVNALLRPLASLAEELSKINLLEPSAIPPVTGYVTEEVDQVVTSVRELFERLEASWRAERESEERLQSMINNTISVIQMNDIEGRYIMVNRQWEKVFKKSASDVIGKTPYSFLPEETVDQLLENDLKAMEAEAPLEYEEKVPQEGGVHTYLTIKFPLRKQDGAVYAICGISTDITERKAAEEILKDSYGKLEAMVAVRTDELNRAKIRAEEATKMKDRFVSLVSHDMKSPLQAIKFLIELIKMETKAPEQVKTVEHVNMINQIVGQMAGMIDELLNLSRLQSGSINLKREFMDCHHVVSEVMSRVSALADKKSIELKNEAPKNTVIYADQHLFYAVIHNLLSNAIKFSKSGGVISVFVPQDGLGSIAVRDSGVGIDAKILPDLFNMEVKTTTTGTAGEKGSGLGLPLCNEIIRAHGGSIHVETEKDKGSTFYVKLPAPAEAGA